ncbi:hypothetical protein M8J76_011446 [Diaphorina citri]|nr:hypothetical protein M8J75_011373 [Diaphorina citri]KAI5737241.1 hypothetical protein M8J76_011446 [Diaphorina citri]KAI5742145.1 hypothetical protein M8J77_003768 [Diaphorina citri]
MAAPILAKHATRNGGISRKCFGNIPAIWRVDFLGQHELLRYQPLNILRKKAASGHIKKNCYAYKNRYGEHSNVNSQGQSSSESFSKNSSGQFNTSFKKSDGLVTSNDDSTVTTAPLADEGSHVTFTRHVISKALKAIKPRKAPGPDNIPGLAIKNSGDLICGVLTALANDCLGAGYFPRAFPTLIHRVNCHTQLTRDLWVGYFNLIIYEPNMKSPY